MGPVRSGDIFQHRHLSVVDGGHVASRNRMSAPEAGAGNRFHEVDAVKSTCIPSSNPTTGV